MPKKTQPFNPVCPFCNKIAVRNGLRSNKKRTTQRYLCKTCRKSFTTQTQHQKYKTYSLDHILNSVSNYNLGIPLRKLTAKNNIPKSTIHNWIKQLKTVLTFNRLRNSIKNQPIHKTIIKKRFIHHNQPFLYQYHTLKLRFAKAFPGLITYLTKLYLPKKAFKSENSKRVSLIAKKPKYTININPKPKQNYATKLAKLASEITPNNRSRHQIVENLMITNDSTTLATEIPVYNSTKNHSNNLTGHIDILQIRYNKLYILDYKPEPINKQQTITQLLLYRHLLSKRTKIPKQRIKLAFFNNKGYYEVK